jgi:amidohydrolase
VTRKSIVACALLLLPCAGAAAPVPLPEINARVDAVAARVVAWRRDIHQHPELANRESRTGALVAAHLKQLGLEVREGVAHTGVVGVLRGAKPGGVVALRADMDALPVAEATGLPFASTATATYDGATVPVAHACGHDAHTAMLMGAAEVLAGLKSEVNGTIVFLFQPAEEGAPAGERGGASLMIDEGALADPAPEAVFGLHVVPGTPGTIFYRPEGFMAAADQVHISLRGKQTHGAWPWKGIDVISLASAVVSELNTLAARTVDVTATPTVLTIATIHGGVRYNIIPEEVVMTGTLRTFDKEQRTQIKGRIEQTVTNLAASYGARAEVKFVASGAVTWNDPALSRSVFSALEEAAGAGKVDMNRRPTTVSEDFSAYQKRIPGVFYHMGASAAGTDPEASAPNHSPQFDVNEAVLPVGVRAHVLTALRWLEAR